MSEIPSIVICAWAAMVSMVAAVASHNPVVQWTALTVGTLEVAAVIFLVIISR